MKIKPKIYSQISSLYLIYCLVGCGGGAGNNATPASNNPQLPPPTQLTASTGALTKYAGIWMSECGQPFFSNEIHSVINVYEFGVAVGNVVPAVLKQRQFTDSNCTTPWAIPETQQKITFTVVAQITLATPTSKYNNFTGIADQVVDTTNALTKTKYVGFSDASKKLYIAEVLPFSYIDLTYTKQ